jgi:HAD superfamily hydrolase (TIGR01549 family)
LIRAAIFDYGETIVVPKKPFSEVLSSATRAPYRLLTRAGLKVPYEEFSTIDRSLFRKYAEMEAAEDRDIPDIIKYRELVDRLFPDLAETWRRRLATEANGAFWKVVNRNYAPERGARRCMRELRSMGLRMAVLSNHHNHLALTDHLNVTGLSGYFVRIFSSDQLGVRKPNPKAFEKCLSALKTSGSETLFVGDSLTKDVGGAKALGMKGILVERESQGRADPPPGPPTPDFTISGLAEVPGIVKLLNGR